METFAKCAINFNNPSGTLWLTDKKGGPGGGGGGPRCPGGGGRGQGSTNTLGMFNDVAPTKQQFRLICAYHTYISVNQYI